MSEEGRIIVIDYMLLCPICGEQVGGYMGDVTDEDVECPNCEGTFHISDNPELEFI